MRKYIISDLHGNGNIYKSIMSYLENVNKEEKVILYINGDLIDRGLESGDMLLDIIDRINNGPFKIIYLAGNHEYMMYNYYKDKENNRCHDYYDNVWYDNGGWATDYSLEDKVDEKDMPNIINFISNLKIYNIFDEMVDGKKIMLVHAAFPHGKSDNSDLSIKDKDIRVFNSLWARDDKVFNKVFYPIGSKNYLTIIGHTPVENLNGYYYNSHNNVLNIDGGCANYVSGLFEYNHVPLVEVKDGYLKILTFNNNNEIMNGNYLYNNESSHMTEKELDHEREYLDNDFKPKRLIKYSDGVIGYEGWK